MNSDTTTLVKRLCANPNCDLEYLVPNDAKRYSPCCSPECKHEVKGIKQRKSTRRLRILNKNKNKKIRTRIEAARYIHRKQGGLSWTCLWEGKWDG